MSYPTAFRPLAAPCLLFMAFAAGGGCSREQGPQRPAFSDERVAARRQELGGELYARYCVHCHGTSGAGDGINAYTLPVKPPVLSSRQWQESKTDGEIEGFIRLGGRLSGRSPFCPEWGKTLAEEGVSHLRCYLRALKDGAGRERNDPGTEAAADR